MPVPEKEDSGYRHDDDNVGKVTVKCVERLHWKREIIIPANKFNCRGKITMRVEEFVGKGKDSSDEWAIYSIGRLSIT
jgi:hypothetical protein